MARLKTYDDNNNYYYNIISFMLLFIKLHKLTSSMADGSDEWINVKTPSNIYKLRTMRRY